MSPSQRLAWAVIISTLFLSFLARAHHDFYGSQQVLGLEQTVLHCEQYPQKQDRDGFLNDLVAQMTVPELVMQLHMMFAENLLGPESNNTYYDFGTRFAPTGGIGVVHDWYPTNKTQYNSLQSYHLSKSRLPVPFLQTGECLHAIGSFRQSTFPQAIGLSASWDEDLVWRVARAIGAEASSIGIHACFSPVLDLGKEPRWGRVQEAWGEDFVLTSSMGVAYASGLSKNGSWSDEDAVVPVMKHFAAHGSSSRGLNGAPSMLHGMRQVMQEMLIPFRDVVQRGGVKGVMMAYSELDEVPSHVHPALYEALAEWGFDGFVIGDDTGMRQLNVQHKVSSSPADTIRQWFNAGGMVQFYDYSVDVYLNSTEALIATNAVALSTLQAHARRVLSVKYDLGLFDNPFIPSDIDSAALTESHIPLTLEAAHKSIVLLENRNSTLPLDPSSQGIQKIALVGPFADTLNFGDYSGTWGGTPQVNASTIRQALSAYLEANASSVRLVSSWGANSWLYNGQYAIPTSYLSPSPINSSLVRPSSISSSGGLLATYYANTNFTDPVFQTIEVPNLSWGLYPPNGLPSNNFSAVWEGNLTVPVDGTVDGWIGVAVYANNTAKLYLDDVLVVTSPLTTSGNILGNIEGLGFSGIVDPSLGPPGGAQWRFKKGKTYKIRIEFQAFNTAAKMENVNSLNAQVELFWNLVDRKDPVEKAARFAKDADVIVMAVGAGWNSDGEGGDRSTLGLSDPQTVLADAMFALGKPVVMILFGGRPFAIPEYYSQAAAVLNVFFPGQSGGQAITDVLFGLYNPGGRIPLSVPYDVGMLPVYYNYKPTDRSNSYLDGPSSPIYSFGYGLSFSTFTQSDFNATSTHGVRSFTAGDNITFHVTVTNDGKLAGSYVAQVYLLGRNVSSITRPVKQLVTFSRVYLESGESRRISMNLEVDRFLPIVNRRYHWELETGDYTFALLDHGGSDADTSVSVTLTCLTK
ncbi:glycoside hydrolase family 3 protein [Mycena floridula]|nr:glycoside hydrolase family 3 protein [Mycena floridula]